jgi:hypothetical protein
MVVDRQDFEMELRIPHYSSDSRFASASSSITESLRGPRQGQEYTEVFSVSQLNPGWSNSCLFLAGLGVMYVIFLLLA